MVLIIISLGLGFLGFCLGMVFGVEFISVLLSIIGILSPTLFVLEKMYKSNKDNNKAKTNFNVTLENLRVNGVLTDLEYEEAYSKFIEEKEKNENRKKYDDGVEVLYRLSQEKTIPENEFNKRLSLLKTLYKQQD